MARGSTSFDLLDKAIQRFLWSAGWEALHAAQEAAIPLILPAERDVIIAAPTAAGKTEAAFLPALTRLRRDVEPGLIVYISPLKALINDQFSRLELLCEQLDIPVWPWHGDISTSVKQRFLSEMQGVLLITPESLEAQLCLRGTAVGNLFERTRYFVIDELHAFIGTERGKQLQSLLHRLEHVIGRRVVRIGLSATLGNMQLAAEFLRAGQADQVALVEPGDRSGELKILVKGFERPWIEPGPNDEAGIEGDAVADDIVPRQIAMHLFRSIRGSNNLIFPNARREVERYTHLLNQLCEEARVPNEFWPHHGSLSKEIRAETEGALKQKSVPATAVCTNTLELGIDIGSVKSVVQIGSPPSVASLRQRLGRSGRRKGEPAILRGYCIEDVRHSHSPLAEELRLSTIQMIAMVELLLEDWFEPPSPHGTHFSTLVQQILALIAQYGGMNAGQLYTLLSAQGAPFDGVDKRDFAELIREMGRQELLMQAPSGILLHGRIGEKFVNHYTFYAAFSTEEEYRISAKGRILGTLPVAQMIGVGQRILFGGATWVVLDVDDSQKTIHVEHAPGGLPPMFSGGAGRIHSSVRQRMRRLLASTEVPVFLDPTAKRFLEEGRQAYANRGLEKETFLDLGKEVQILTWLGDGANEAIACLLGRCGLNANADGIGVEVQKGAETLEYIVDRLIDAGLDAPPDVHELLHERANLEREKWDWALSRPLLYANYASLYLDLEDAFAWLRKIGDS